ncbi:MAG: HAD family phosphatase [Bryobacteraceae bacterium]|nr:HAD family phosphatase [Bryobacteraceae bacterium]
MRENLRVAPGLAFLFDMDGVLIESTGMHTRAWEEYLARHGIPSAGVMEKMLGKRNDQIVRVLWGPEITEDEVFRHGAEKERLYRELMEPVFEEHVVKGVREFVLAASAAGVPCALATNAEPANVEFVLGRTGLRDCFRAIVDGHQVQRPKPDPEVFLTAAARLGVPPHNCIIFEDSPGGLEAARASGGRVVAVLTTLREAPAADLAVRDFLDPSLLPWLSHQTAR